MPKRDNCPVCGQKNISFSLFAKDFTVTEESFELWKCRDCGVRFTQNIPDKTEIGKYYQSENYISHSDSAKGLINSLYHKVRKRTLNQKKKLVTHFTGKHQGRILDVGAGTGAFLNTMQGAHWQIEGIEQDAFARNQSEQLYGIKTRMADDLFNLPGRSFDAITLWHVLEHVHDLHPYLSQFDNLLKKGGKLFIAVPNFTSFDADYYGSYWAAYDVPRHLYHFSPQAMKTLLRIHGFTLEAMKPMWYDSIYVSMLSEKYKTGKTNPLKSAFVGLKSNSKALFNVEKCSSIIYIASQSA